jgi:hypothetical protein
MRLGAAMPPAAGAPSRGGNGTFHSFNIGYIHVVLVSSEVYFSLQKHSGLIAVEQAEFLEADLKAVDRTVTPFVVLGLHQPFYCSPNVPKYRSELAARLPIFRLPPPFLLPPFRPSFTFRNRTITMTATQLLLLCGWVLRRSSLLAAWMSFSLRTSTPVRIKQVSARV